jgi:hypothetical protein
VLQTLRPLQVLFVTTEKEIYPLGSSSNSLEQTEPSVDGEDQVVVSGYSKVREKELDS